MGQAASWGVSEAGPQTPSAHAVENNDSLDAVLSGHSGTSRPSYAVAGTIWTDIVSGTEENTYRFDGTDDILLYTINPTANTVTYTLTGVALLTAAQTFTKTQTWTKGADVAAASNLVLGDGNYFDITVGTGTINTIATKGIGTTIKQHFDGAVLLVNSVDLVLPGGANYTTVAGDEFEFNEYAAGDWRCTGYTLTSGGTIISGSGIWTPVLTFDTPGDLSVAYSSQSGQYRKSGGVITLNCNIVTSTFTHSTASGNLKITGLPFAVSNTSFGMAQWGGINLTTGYTNMQSLASGSEISFRQSGDNNAIQNISTGQGSAPSGNTIEIKFTMTYLI